MVWPLSPSDARGLAENYSHLSDRSRYQRFFSPLRELSPSLLRLLVDSVDSVEHVALLLVVFPTDGPDRAGARVRDVGAVPGRVRCRRRRLGHSVMRIGFQVLKSLAPSARPANFQPLDLRFEGRTQDSKFGGGAVRTRYPPNGFAQCGLDEGFLLAKHRGHECS